MLHKQSEFSVETSMIEKKHKIFTKMISKVITAAQHNSKPDEILGILSEMTKYSQEQFRTEEAYMTGYNYPNYRCHKEEHLDFAFRTLAFYGMVINSNYNILNEILEFLKQWYVYHIQGTDKKYVDFFKKNGV